MIRIICIIVLNLSCKICFAQNQINVVPYPNNVKMGKGYFKVSASTNIIYNRETEKLAKYFNEQVKNLTGLSLKNLLYNSKQNQNNKNSIQFFVKKNTLSKYEYSLVVSNTNINIEATDNDLLFNGIQTLLQLFLTKNTAHSISIPQLSILDAPRFAYRGMHLDVSRHFFPVAFVKKYIDLLAMHKYNTFHWHLTDDQGWRVEIKKYPLLTEIGGYRNGTIIGRYPGTGNDGKRYGGYYTQEQIKEIVQYAGDRYITVIPEIEMPGHASAAIAAYPQLSCFPNEDTEIDSTTAWTGSRRGKQIQQTWGVFNDVFTPTDYTFKFLENILDEVMQLFPSKYIHIGGDECPKENWKRSSFCQELIKEKNLKDEHGLQSYFIQRIEKYVNSKGRKIFGWDEILEGGLAPNAAIMSWRGTEGGIAAAKENHNVVMTPGSHCYFDHSQTNEEDSITIGGYLPLENVYDFEPVPVALNAAEAMYILGAQGNVWTEYMTNESKVEYMVLPRIAALAEVLWSAKGKKSFVDFENRLPFILEKYSARNYNYSTAFYDLKSNVIKMPNNKIGWKLQTKNNVANILLKINGKPFKNYTEPVTINGSGEYEAATADKNGSVNSKWIKQYFKINSASGKLITLKNKPNDSYSGNGAFSLVDGIQNSRGMAKSEEFLGFLATDLEAVIDMGDVVELSEVRIHTFTRKASWIYPPKQNSTKVLISDDGINFTLPQDELLITEGSDNVISKITFYPSKKTIKTRYLKIITENYGTIPNGNPGAGTGAWLFVDEIEVY